MSTYRPIVYISLHQFTLNVMSGMSSSKKIFHVGQFCSGQALCRFFRALCQGLGPGALLVVSEDTQGAWLFTIWLFNIAMENGSFIDDFPIKTSIYSGFSMAMLNNQMVISLVKRFQGSNPFQIVDPQSLSLFIYVSVRHSIWVPEFDDGTRVVKALRLIVDI